MVTLPRERDGIPAAHSRFNILYLFSLTHHIIGPLPTVEHSVLKAMPIFQFTAGQPTRWWSTIFLKTMELTTPDPAWHTREPSQVMEAHTISMSTSRWTNHQLKVLLPSTSTGPSVRINVSAEPSPLPTISRPGQLSAWIWALSTTRSCPLKAMRAADLLISLFLKYWCDKTTNRMALHFAKWKAENSCLENGIKDKICTYLPN